MVYYSFIMMDLASLTESGLYYFYLFEDIDIYRSFYF